MEGRTFDLERAIQATLPDGHGSQCHRAIFEFARILKFAPRLDKSPENLRVMFAAWHVRAQPFIKDQLWQESWEDFQRAYVEAKCPAGNTLKTALVKALANPIGDIDGRFELGILGALCRELQTVHGNGSFFLSNHVAANLLSHALGRTVDPKQALRWLRSLQFHGVISLQKKGLVGKAGDMASEWRFLGAANDTNQGW